MDRYRRHRLGSFALLVLVAAVLLRPWEAVQKDGGSGPVAADAYVVRVIDGDTVEARFDSQIEDVRMIGVDTPETVKPGTPVQCFGPRASRFEHRLLEQRRVHLVFGVERRDIYGRLLAYVHLGPLFVNAELLRRGLARTLAIAPNTRFASRFRGLELKAARNGKGLWGVC